MEWLNGRRSEQEKPMNNAQEFLDLLKHSMEVSPEGCMKSSSCLATFFRAKYRPDGETGAPLNVALVGVPSELGLTQRTGGRHGSREIRNQSSNVLYYNPLLGDTRNTSFYTASITYEVVTLLAEVIPKK